MTLPRKLILIFDKNSPCCLRYIKHTFWSVLTVVVDKEWTI